MANGGIKSEQRIPLYISNFLGWRHPLARGFGKTILKPVGGIFYRRPLGLVGGILGLHLSFVDSLMPKPLAFYGISLAVHGPTTAMGGFRVCGPALTCMTICLKIGDAGS